jgi:sugar lactone lactonase YvrE
VSVTDWEVAVGAGAELGERPVWDPAEQSLIWVDINAGRLHRYRPGRGDEIVLELAEGGRPVPPRCGAAAGTCWRPPPASG